MNRLKGPPLRNVATFFWIFGRLAKGVKISKGIFNLIPINKKIESNQGFEFQNLHLYQKKRHLALAIWQNWCLQDLHLIWKQGPSTKHFETSPSWHQQKDLVFIKWKRLFQKWMDFSETNNAVKSIMNNYYYFYELKAWPVIVCFAKIHSFLKQCFSFYENKVLLLMSTGDSLERFGGRTLF